MVSVSSAQAAFTRRFPSILKLSRTGWTGSRDVLEASVIIVQLLGQVVFSPVSMEMEST